MQVKVATLASLVCSGLLVFGGYRLHIALAENNPWWWLWIIPIAFFGLFSAFIVAYYSTRYFNIRGY